MNDMEQMTWKEFKDAVDKLLAKKGISENEPIWYIDISFLNKKDFEMESLTISLDEHCGIAI